MWLIGPDTFAHQHRLTIRMARPLQATAEHILQRRLGGTNAPANIAAAHAICNRRRERYKSAVTFDGFKARVGQRVKQGRWFSPVYALFVETCKPAVE